MTWEDPEVVALLERVGGLWPLRRRSLDLQEAVMASVCAISADAETEGVAIPVAAVVADVRSGGEEWAARTIENCVAEMCETGALVSSVRTVRGRAVGVKLVRLSVWGARWVSGRWSVAPRAGWTDGWAEREAERALEGDSDE